MTKTNNDNHNNYNILDEPVAEFFQWKYGKFRIPRDEAEAGYCIRGVVHAVQQRMLLGVWGPVEVSCEEIMKNNDKIYHGILIRREDQYVIPTIYVEDCLKGLTYNDKMEEVADRIISMYADGLKVAPKLNTDFSYGDEGYQDLLEVRLIDRKLNAKRCDSLLTMPLDAEFAYIIYLVIAEDEHGTMGAALTREIAEELVSHDGLEYSDLFDIAIENSMRRHWPIMADIHQIVDTRAILGNWIEKCGEEIPNLLGDMELCDNECTYVGNRVDISQDERYMFLLTNDTGSMGSAVLFYPGIQDAIHKVLNCNYYVLPSSVHDVLIVPDTEAINERALMLMVSESNNSVVEGNEILSNRVYKYTPATGLEVCA